MQSMQRNVTGTLLLRILVFWPYMKDQVSSYAEQEKYPSQIKYPGMDSGNILSQKEVCPSPVILSLPLDALHLPYIDPSGKNLATAVPELGLPQQPQSSGKRHRRY